MKLNIKSVGKVDSAGITLDSISVIAGYNGSGKTTISKCLYGMLELTREKKLDKEIVKTYWKNLFANQMATFGRDELDQISLDGDNFSLSLLREGNKELEIRKKGKADNETIYLRSPSRWSDWFSDKLKVELEKPLVQESSELLLKYMDILDSNASGYLKKTDSGYVYVDEDFPEQDIALDNTASGIMIFLELSRLIGNGTIKPNSTLIIDEPETNLHPEKQVALARVLTRLSSQMNIKMFLSSHNIYFIRALEVALQEEEIGNYHFYSMKKDPDTHLYSSQDVTDNLEIIYDDLYRPMEEL